MCFTYQVVYPATAGSLSLFLPLEVCLAPDGGLSLGAQCLQLQVNVNVIAVRCANSGAKPFDVWDNKHSATTLSFRVPFEIMLKLVLYCNHIII